MKTLLHATGLALAIGTAATSPVLYAGDAVATAAGATTLESENSSPTKQKAYKLEAEKLLECPKISDPQKLVAAFGEKAVMKWDRKEMGCGLEYGLQAALASPENIELTLMVIGAHVDYLSVLDKSYSRLYSDSPVKTIELGLRWDKTRANAKQLIDKLAHLENQVPAASALHGLFLLLSSAHNAPDKDRLQAPAVALPYLQTAVNQDPKVLDGAGLLTIGTVLASIPEFAGGDVEQSLKLLEQGTKLFPANLQLKTELINVQLSEHNFDAALAVLNDAAKVGPEGQPEQDYADSLRILIGQSVRLQKKDIGLSFEKKRDEFLAAHPYLDQRKTTATSGHGGVDPITGQDPNKL